MELGWLDDGGIALWGRIEEGTGEISWRSMRPIHPSALVVVGRWRAGVVPIAAYRTTGLIDACAAKESRDKRRSMRTDPWPLPRLG